MQNHADRSHSAWSASSTERNWQCPGSMALTDGLPERVSEAADWGTVAHMIAERCLREDIALASKFLGQTERGKQFSFEVDEEMVETIQLYLNYIRQAIITASFNRDPYELFHIEQNFSLAALNPPFEAGGTADAVIYHPTERLLEVVDLKGGRGVVVEVKGNPQGRSYALGAMLANPQWDVDYIRVTIVQPRANHRDGQIRSETFHVADLVEWTTDLMTAMNRSNDAILIFKDRNMPVAEWNAKFLNPGNHCKFCKARGFCPALEQKALDEAGVWFDDLDQPRITNAPDAMSAEALAKKLDMLDMIQEWMNGVRAYAHSQAEAGVEIPGYQLVEKIGNRAWKDEQAAVQTLKPHLPPAILYTQKLVSPAQAEKALGVGRKGLLEPLVERPVRGTNLVAMGRTTRPAIPPAVERHFDILE